MRLFLVLLCLLPALVTPLTAAAGEIVIAGTGDSQKLLRALADDYENAHPGTRVTIPPSIGSTGGIRAVAAGKLVLGRIARGLTPQEAQLGLTCKVFGLSPVVLIVNNSVTGIDNLDAGQVCDLFSGRTERWSQLGGPDRKIYLVHREAGDSSRLVLEGKLPCFSLGDFSGPIFYSTPEAMAALGQNNDTIGYGPLAMVDPRRMRVLKFAGRKPTLDDDSDYPLVAPFSLIWKGRLDQAHQRFVDYLFTPQAAKIMRSFGVRPLAD